MIRRPEKPNFVASGVTKFESLVNNSYQKKLFESSIAVQRCKILRYSVFIKASVRIFLGLNTNVSIFHVCWSLELQRMIHFELHFDEVADCLH